MAVEGKLSKGEAADSPGYYLFTTGTGVAPWRIEIWIVGSKENRLV
jgi:hypothetical protein